MRAMTLCGFAFPLALVTTGLAGEWDKSQLAGLALVHEAYVDENWEIFTTRADGSSDRNLTNTPDQHEMYPQVSADGKWICYVRDTGTGRNTVRSVWVMDLDGQNRKQVADYARQPCWHPNSQTIAYLPQEFQKFNIVDYFTKGLIYYDLKTGEKRPHPNSGKLHHLYNPSFSADGKWIAATVHAGMGYSHAGLLIEAEGDRIIDLKISGCRPCLNTDGKRIAWGEDDHKVVVAELDVSAEDPRMGQRLLEIHDRNNKIYHVDWSPDGEFVSVSRGPNGKGDPQKPGTHEAACEMVGVYAAGWDLVVVPVSGQTKVDLTTGEGHFLQITDDGNSNKESDWYVVRP